MKTRNVLILIVILVLPTLVFAKPLPNGFVYLKDIAPSILQDMRYSSYHNNFPINAK